MAETPWSDGSLGFNRCEYTERVNALGYSTGDGKIAFAKPQHLDPLDDPRVSRRTCSSDRVVRASNPHVQSDLARRIIRDRARIVVMGPDARIVIELGDRVDLILGLDISMFGNPDINADARLVDVRPIQTTASNRLTCRPDAYGPGPRPTPSIASILVLGPLKLAYSSVGVAYITDVVVPNPAATG
jgi:hypothetical protein